MKLTVTEAARLLGVPEPEVYDWIKHRGLPHVRVQEAYYIYRARLHEWARERCVCVHPDLFRGARGGSPACGAELAQAIHLGGISHLPTPQSALEGARAMLTTVHLDASVDRLALLAVMAARPDLGFAAGRDCVALPHLSEPVLSPGAASLWLFAFPMPWTVGDARVDRIFTLITPTVRLHQRLLAELDAALHQLDFREAVRQAQSSHRLEDLARQASGPWLAVAAK